MNYEFKGKQEKALHVNKNGNVWGESIINNAWSGWIDHQKFIKETQGQFRHLDGFYDIRTQSIKANPDYPVEVFLQDGRVAPPYLRSFQVCKLARWYCPDCIPGIISQIFDGTRSFMIVLYANEQYIELQDEEELFQPYRQLAIDHFIRRGLNNIVDPTNRHVQDLERILNPRGYTENGYAYRGTRPQRNRVSFSWSTKESPQMPSPEWTTPRTIRIGVDTASGKSYSTSIIQ